jgi:hypothetical protein
MGLMGRMGMDSDQDAQKHIRVDIAQVGRPPVGMEERRLLWAAAEFPCGLFIRLRLA